MAVPTYLTTPGGSSTGAGSTFASSLVNAGNEAALSGAAGTGSTYLNRDGYDLVWSHAYLQTQMANLESDMDNIENNANLSDTEKMYSMQMAMNTWSAIATLRTNMMKSVSDVLQSICRNVAT